jgi:Fe-S-cluster-containing dehydrogenase component
MAVCPVKAIGREETLGYVKVDYDLCIGCRACVTACPFGAMNFNGRDKKVFKCDLCEGEPYCVRFCEVKALDYVDADQVSMTKKREAALKLTEAQKKAAALDTTE